MRNARYGILKMETQADGRTVVPTTIPSSTRTRRAYAHLARLMRAAPPGTKYRMLEHKLSSVLYPSQAYTAPSRKH